MGAPQMENEATRGTALILKYFFLEIMVRAPESPLLRETAASPIFKSRLQLFITAKCERELTQRQSATLPILSYSILSTT
jgi:hypothetical protein